MKLWQKEKKLNSIAEHFTIGKDREFDLQLATFDVIGSLAHSEMLCSCQLISEKEKEELHRELKNILATIRSEKFTIDEKCEDIHSQIEFLLTEKLGDTGKKIHTARSRNDQSLLDIKLFCRNKIMHLAEKIEKLFSLLQTLSEKNKNILLPGYTHLQLAMPSSFGLWFGAFAESLCDDLELLLAAYKITDKNPLGSAAGFGSSFPIDRDLTTSLLGFSEMNINSVYAQMTRGKTEKTISIAIASVASTLSKLAMDCTLYMSSGFGFISFPDELTTGSSIMPHKKNPDVWELIRGKCNRLQSVPNEFSLLLNNLPSGYHRELQLTKEILFPAFEEINSCIDAARLMLENIKVKTDIPADEKYDLLFTVDAVNELVKKNIPFREAYRQVAIAVETGNFIPDRTLPYTHAGSIGDPGNERIRKIFIGKMADFKFEKAISAMRKLAD